MSLNFLSQISWQFQFGLTVYFDTKQNDYEILQTEISILDEKQENVEISITPFVNLNKDVVNHGKDFSFVKRRVLKVLSFSGGIFDWFRLVFLQFLRTVFDIRLRLKRNS